MPALPGLGSLSGQRGVPVAAHPGSAVGSVHSSPRPARAGARRYYKYNTSPHRRY